MARELTERWHHQQQIRLAVGAPPLTDPRFSAPVLETFLHALPHRMPDAPEGTSLSITITGERDYPFTLRRDSSEWALYRGTAAVAASSSVNLPEEAAWLLLTKGLSGEDARGRAEVEGDEHLVAPVFSTLAVMA